MKTKNALGYKKVVEGLKSLGQVVTANAIEKEEAGRDRNKSYLFGGVFYFFVLCYRKRRDMECFGRNIVLLWEC